MEWTVLHDVMLAREILVTEPFRFKKGTVERGKAWGKVADNLNSANSEGTKFKVSMRSVRDRFNLIQGKWKKLNGEDERSSGTAVVPTELDYLLEEITEKEREALVNQDEKVGKMESERAKAEEARRKAMERMGETRKRKEMEGAKEDERETKKRSRGSGSETILFLRERYQQERELRESELALKQQQAAEASRKDAEMQKTMRDMMALMAQNQAAILQQQQQQGQALLAILAQLAKK